MSNKTIRTVCLVYSILLSVLLVMTGVLLIVGCVSIYQSGPRPFNPDSISAAFAKIQVPVYVTLGAVAVGIVLRLIFPEEKKKAKITVDQRMTLRRLEKRLLRAGISPATPAAKRERRLRRAWWIAALLLSATLFIPTALFVFDPAHFTLTSFNTDMAAAALRLIPAFLLATAVVVAATYLCRTSYAREIDLAKKELAAAPKDTAKTADTQPTDGGRQGKRHLVLPIVRLAILVLGVVFIILGIFNGGMADVLYKAINICTECIGLG